MENLPERSRHRVSWVWIAAIVVVVLVAGGLLGAYLILRSNETRHYQAANDLYVEGRWEEAVAEYTEALAVQPDLVRQHTDLARCGPFPSR
jgi:flagellar basal body-associated protein FliL